MRAQAGRNAVEESRRFGIRRACATRLGIDVLRRLITFPNVLVTSHQAYFTETALRNISETTLANLNDFAAGRASANEVRAEGACGAK